MDQVLPEVRRAVRFASALLLAGSAACGGRDARAAAHAPAKHPPGYIVDSIFPREEALRRFRAGLDSPAKLDGPSRRDALVEGFFAAVRQRDRVALARLLVNRAEFAYLVFPESRVSRPPYNEQPSIAWMLSSAKSDAAVNRLVERAPRYDMRGYRCDKAEVDGRLTLWTRCVVRVRESGRVKELRLFGTIVERDGRFKFTSYASDL